MPATKTTPDARRNLLTVECSGLTESRVIEALEAFILGRIERHLRTTENSHDGRATKAAKMPALPSRRTGTRAVSDALPSRKKLNQGR